ncbi:MAG: hypothetical protein ACOYNF_01875, partial [Rhodoferax sp.]
MTICIGRFYRAGFGQPLSTAWPWLPLWVWVPPGILHHTLQGIDMQKIFSLLGLSLALSFGAAYAA